MMNKRIRTGALALLLALAAAGCSTGEALELSRVPTEESAVSVSEESSQPESESEPESESSAAESSREESEVSPADAGATSDEPAPIPKNAASVSSAPEVSSQPEESSESSEESEPSASEVELLTAEEPARSEATRLSTADITVYVQHGGNTLSVLPYRYLESFVKLVNRNMETTASGTGASAEATFMVVRDDYTKYFYTLTPGTLEVNTGSFFKMDNADYSALKALADPVATTATDYYAQWLVYMNPGRVTGVQVQPKLDEPAFSKTDNGEFWRISSMIRDMRVAPGKSQALSIDPPYGDSKIRLQFDSGVNYTLTFAGNDFFLQSSDMGYCVKYTLECADDKANLFDYLVNGAPLGANPETGKPVIYLYPEKTTDVEVKLDFQGRLAYTFPTYDNGWRVTAQPDGTLTNRSDGSTHYYLFWDGFADKKDWSFDEGFVVKGGEVQSFFQKVLPQMGLTPREYNDFITYWTPELARNPYNLITFSTTEYEAVAPLTVTPAPDTVLRVHMVYKALQSPVSIPEQKLPQPPERKGFTVVEWGGTRG